MTISEIIADSGRAAAEWPVFRGRQIERCVDIVKENFSCSGIMVLSALNKEGDRELTMVVKHDTYTRNFPCDYIEQIDGFGVKSMRGGRTYKVNVFILDKSKMIIVPQSKGSVLEIENIDYDAIQTSFTDNARTAINICQIKEEDRLKTFVTVPCLDKGQPYLSAFGIDRKVVYMGDSRNNNLNAKLNFFIGETGKVVGLTQAFKGTFSWDAKNSTPVICERTSEVAGQAFPYVQE